MPRRFSKLQRTCLAAALTSTSHPQATPPGGRRQAPVLLHSSADLEFPNDAIDRFALAGFASDKVCALIR